ncbi:MAG: TonB-dependent receptor plug domain-containing protein, partial [Cyclobacteriaceae bacterium]|nr:TonB-dependent receptor plug domain-containing protein [Cyclobacteriaceae bacterium]
MFPCILVAQVSVSVRDKTTGKEVEGALVYAMNKEGVILSQAVSDGKSHLILKGINFPYTLAISHLSYEGYSEEVSGPGEIIINIETRLNQLDDVVVTGQYEPQSAKQSVYKVRTIALERIEATGATRLQDVLNTELNTRFSQDLATGGSNLSLQGLAGQNVKVLIDGVPMVGRQGTGNEININQINVQTIDRIEIVEGPMSVMYGADALAGVINIITKKPEEGKWTGSFRLHEETVGDEYGVNQGIHNESISLGVTKKSFYSMVDVGRNYFGGWEGSAVDRDREWHPKTQWFGSALAGYKKNSSDIYYRLDYLNENIYNPGLYSGIEAIDQRYITDRFMHQVQASVPVSDR